MLTLGPPEAEEQLRDMMAIGVDRAVHLVTDGGEWDPQATAAAIVAAVRPGGPYDLSCSATSRPTPATTRWRSGSPGAGLAVS